VTGRFLLMINRFFASLRCAQNDMMLGSGWDGMMAASLPSSHPTTLAPLITCHSERSEESCSY